MIIFLIFREKRWVLLKDTQLVVPKWLPGKSFTLILYKCVKITHKFIYTLMKIYITVAPVQPKQSTTSLDLMGLYHFYSNFEI